MQWVADANTDGARIDRAIADWRGLSRAAVLRLLDSGGVTLNDRELKRSDKGKLLRCGDRIEIDSRYDRGEVIRPNPSLELTVLKRSVGWIAVDKPAGMPVRPHALDEIDTVLNAVAAIDENLIGVGEGGLRCGVVHRLDTDTSGVLIVATDSSAWAEWRTRFAEHHLTKQYLAIVAGRPDERGEAELWLRVGQHKPARVLVCKDASSDPAARRCSLTWRTVEQIHDQAAMIEVDLHTGFLHQVRVTMAHLGHPILGDQVYGRPAHPHNVPRHMLHARRLAWDLGEVIAPIPQDMSRVLDALRSS